MLNLNKKPVIGGAPEMEPDQTDSADSGGDTIGAGETAASRAILTAIKGGDSGALRAALKDFAAACGWGSSDDSSGGAAY